VNELEFKLATEACEAAPRIAEAGIGVLKEAGLLDGFDSLAIGFRARKLASLNALERQFSLDMFGSEGKVFQLNPIKSTSHGLPPFDLDGDLPAGVHPATWTEFQERFGTNPHRLGLMQKLQQALNTLKDGGCRELRVGPSFATNKALPTDFDAVWMEACTNRSLIDIDLRTKSMAAYGGHIYGDSVRVSSRSDQTFLDFFSKTRAGKRVGMVSLNPQDVPIIPGPRDNFLALRSIR
jgi:hypothetical protein